MASSEKTSSVFTRSGMGDGPSSGIHNESMPGGTMKIATGQDNVHGVSLPDKLGGKMGGSTSNLSHSLTGASAVQRAKG